MVIAPHRIRIFRSFLHVDGIHIMSFERKSRVPERATPCCQFQQQKRRTVRVYSKKRRVVVANSSHRQLRIQASATCTRALLTHTPTQKRRRKSATTCTHACLPAMLGHKYVQFHDRGRMSTAVVKDCQSWSGIPPARHAERYQTNRQPNPFAETYSARASLSILNSGQTQTH